MRQLRPVDHRRARPGRVLAAQFERVHADLLGQHVDDALDREGRDRRPRRAIGGRFRPVADDVVADRVGVLDRIGRKGAQARVHHRRAREGAGLELEDALGGGDLAVLRDAHLDPHRRTRGRAGGLEHLVAGHRDLHRAAGFLRQQRRDRLQIDDGLAAEPAADLGRGAAYVADRLVQQLGGQRADDEMALARRPDLGLPVGIDAHAAGMRLDIALMHRGGLELLLDDHVGLGEAGIEIADLEFELFRDVRRLGRGRLDAARDHVLEQQRRVFLHRLVDVDRVRQHLVIDIDQRQRLFGGGGVDRGDGGDRMALIEHLLARHDVARHVPEIDRDPLGADILEFVVREILRGHDRLDARQRRGLRGVDRADAGMRVRRAQDPADDRAGHRVVGGIHRLAGDLRHAVRTDRPGSHPFIAAHDIVHGCSPSSGCRR